MRHKYLRKSDPPLNFVTSDPSAAGLAECQLTSRVGFLCVALNARDVFQRLQTFGPGFLSPPNPDKNKLSPLLHLRTSNVLEPYITCKEVLQTGLTILGRKPETLPGDICAYRMFLHCGARIQRKCAEGSFCCGVAAGVGRASLHAWQVTLVTRLRRYE